MRNCPAFTRDVRWSHETRPRRHRSGGAAHARQSPGDSRARRGTGGARGGGRCRRGGARRLRAGGGARRDRQDHAAPDGLRPPGGARPADPHRPRARAGEWLRLRHRPPAHRAGPRIGRPRRVGRTAGRRGRARRPGVRLGRRRIGRGRRPVRDDARPLLAGREPRGAPAPGDRGGRRALGRRAVAAVARPPRGPHRRPAHRPAARRAQRPGRAGDHRRAARLPAVRAAAAPAARQRGDGRSRAGAARRAGGRGAVPGLP